MSHANTVNYAYRDADSYANCYPDGDTYTNADSHSHGNADGYTDAWPDHTDGVRTQGAEQAYGGSLLDRSELGQHRHLP